MIGMDAEKDILRGKAILLGVAGGIAAYKAAALASALAQSGAEVDVVMTTAAREFISPLTFSTLTRRTVHSDPWLVARRPEHIALAERPDLIVVAPATANTMAKIVHGIADNLLSSVLLAARKPAILAPAMNAGMWESPATRRNVETLLADGYRLIGPNSGVLACGDRGVGRMAEPSEILAVVRGWLAEIAAAALC
jgi:phosphopantothenoylcysteine decarboxylase/phosphopantothenate--cysteine ligase